MSAKVLGIEESMTFSEISLEMSEGRRLVCFCLMYEWNMPKTTNLT